ncbi:GH25 family lysozyme [Oceanivirga miroungae]|uniref:Glycoside hydrolase n=1 Tax=Oceanivirga miroungae TaxID=1130046 RepID=A0A6I8M8F3_9FUSO|nr:GH25 family lysozyme [Oceanivirga miroungae]VWL85741.1 glycoside hydrolase [Oceanivirga miroungae]
MRKLKIAIIFIIVINILLVILNLEILGIIYHNDILASKYAIKGLDISHHQDRINWDKVNKKYKFILIKATEGSNFLDKDYFYNINRARMNGFYVGSYHYFTTKSSGKDQALWYISNVGKTKNTFAPIIDVELSKSDDKNSVLKQVKEFIYYIEKFYERKVIIYTNYYTYKKYIKNELKENKLWIRDIKYYPEIEEDNRWIIWQYSNRGRVSGIKGFTDKNALRYDLEYYIK